VKLSEALSVTHYRTLSVNNMVYHRDKESRVIGMLSDFDIVTHRSGAAPFMALDLLAEKPCKQELEHDFESALYIMLWVALGYKEWKPPTTGDPLSDWRRGTWSQICMAKKAFIASNSEDISNLLSPVPPHYQVLCPKIRELLLVISWRISSKVQEGLARGLGKQWPNVGPMTPQEFFDIIGPPPPGREPYSQTSMSYPGLISALISRCRDLIEVEQLAFTSCL
jgi:Fungal protein kinase